MPFSPEDLIALAYMARDAAMGRDGGESKNEYERGELAAFAAMTLDKENSYASSDESAVSTCCEQQ